MQDKLSETSCGSFPGKGIFSAAKTGFMIAAAATDNGHGTFSGRHEIHSAPLPDPPIRRRTLWRVQEKDNLTNNDTSGIWP